MVGVRTTRKPSQLGPHALLVRKALLHLHLHICKFLFEFYLFLHI
jgi:hypothetical protein